MKKNNKTICLVIFYCFLSVPILRPKCIFARLLVQGFYVVFSKVSTHLACIPQLRQQYHFRLQFVLFLRHLITDIFLYQADNCCKTLFVWLEHHNELMFLVHLFSFLITTYAIAFASGTIEKPCSSGS